MFCAMCYADIPASKLVHIRSMNKLVCTECIAEKVNYG